MDNVSMIAVIGKNNELGIDNKLIWHLPGDLQFFKKVTMGKDVIMGSNTFYSLPKMLPGRKHVVLTSKDFIRDGVLVVNSKKELLEYLKAIREEVFIIGGGSVYKQFLEYCDKVYLTHVDEVCESANVFFPEINYDLYDSLLLGENSDNNINYKHVLYKKKR